MPFAKEQACQACLKLLEKMVGRSSICQQNGDIEEGSVNQGRPASFWTVINDQ
jgi:hypothetical protein